MTKSNQNELKYEIYRTYDPNATTKIDLRKYLENQLLFSDSMFKYVKEKHNEQFEEFLNGVLKYLREDIADYQTDQNILNPELLKRNCPFLKDYTDLTHGILTIITKYLDIPANTNLDVEQIELLLFNLLRAKHMIVYYELKTLIDIFGREQGIQVYKDFILAYAIELGKKQKSTQLTREARENTVKYWKESGGFDFAVYDYDPEKYLVKFTRCVWHESMKDMDDPELCNYVVCYPGRVFTKYTNKYVVKKVTKTLFEREFCDELYYNCEVHKDPEPPTEELIKRLI
ncbi:MAG: L-2-amino-thiazoline-4-carboxylic acid hydrolase [Candidatus Hermodarchaeota archaeon]